VTTVTLFPAREWVGGLLGVLVGTTVFSLHHGGGWIVDPGG